MKKPIKHSSKINYHAATMLLTACHIRDWVTQKHAAKLARGDTLIMIPEAAAAVVMAAAAAEAFINELAEMISMERQNTADWPEPPPMAPEIAAAAVAVLDVEARRGKTQEKYAEAARALGQPLNKGGPSFQEFRRLYTLRDALMHVHPVRPEERHAGEEVTDALAAKGIALKGEAPGNFSWWDRLGTPGVAQWAIIAARDMILALLERIPGPMNISIQHFRGSLPQAARVQGRLSPKKNPGQGHAGLVGWFRLRRADLPAKQPAACMGTRLADAGAALPHYTSCCSSQRAPAADIRVAGPRYSPYIEVRLG